MTDINDQKEKRSIFRPLVFTGILTLLATVPTIAMIVNCKNVRRTETFSEYDEEYRKEHTYDHVTLDGERRLSVIDDENLSYTEISYRPDGTGEVRRMGHGMGRELKHFYDYDGDGLVDKVYLSNDHYSNGRLVPRQSFVKRSEHYSIVPDLFHEADREYQQQLQRFGIELNNSH